MAKVNQPIHLPPAGPYLPDPRVRVHPSHGGTMDVLSPDIVAGNFSNIAGWVVEVNVTIEELYDRMAKIEDELAFYKKFSEYVEVQHPGITNDFLAVEAVAERLGVNENDQ